MKMKINTSIIILLLMSPLFFMHTTGNCADTVNTGKLISNQIEKADGKTVIPEIPADAPINHIYWVLGIVLTVWFGISFYLFYLNRKIIRIEKMIK